MTRPSSLRSALQSAVEARKRTLKYGWTQRKDYDVLNDSIRRVEQFLLSSPNASDELVRRWCEMNVQHVGRVVPGNQPRVLAKLIMDELHNRSIPKPNRA